MAYLDYDGLSTVRNLIDNLYVRADKFNDDVRARIYWELDPIDGTVKLCDSIAADETTKTVWEGTTSGTIEVITPDRFAGPALLLYLRVLIEHRANLVWMNGSELEFSTLQARIDTQTNAAIVYARGRSSMAYGVAGVDTSWTIEVLPNGTYELPPATASTLGGVKVGNGLSVATDGTLSSDLDYAASPTSGGNAVRANGILYAAVDSTSTSTNFTATVTGLTELYDGACVMLHNGVVTSAKGFTVNVNDLGAKKCYSNMTNATQETTIFNVAYTLMFVYSTALDSGNGGWWVYRGYDANTTYTPVKLGFGYGHCTTAAATAAKTVAISSYTLNTGGIVTVLFDNDVQAGATLNVNSKGAKAIYHKGAAITDGVINAGDTATFMYSGQYHLVSVDRAIISDGSITTDKLANGAVTTDKLAWNDVVNNLAQDITLQESMAAETIAQESLIGGIPFKLIATDAASQAIARRLGGNENVPVMQPADLYDASTGTRMFMRDAMMLVWLNGTVVEGARLQFYGVINGTNVIPYVYAKGNGSMASGVLGVDTSWTITALPTDADGVSY